MQRNLLTLLTILIFSLRPEVGATQQTNDSKMDPKLWATALDKAVMHIIVSLNVPYRSERDLTSDGIVAQRQAIVDAQNKLLAALHGTTHKATGLFATIAGIALVVGPDALAVLERSELVKKITADVALSLH